VTKGKGNGVVDDICKVCGKPGASTAYFCTGMVAVVYLHHACDRLVSSEDRQAWVIEQQAREASRGLAKGKRRG